MATFTELVDYLWRDFTTDGLRASGLNEPDKPDIRAMLGPALDTAFAAQTVGSVTVTKATVGVAGGDPTNELAADLAHDAGATALVYADGTPANNDIWLKSGASGAGAWINTGIVHIAITSLAAPLTTLSRQWASKSDGTDVDPANYPGLKSSLYYATALAPLPAAFDSVNASNPAYPLARTGSSSGVTRVFQALVKGGVDSVMRLPSKMKRRGNEVDWSRTGLFGPWLSAIVARPGLSGLAERRMLAVHGKTGETHLRYPRRIAHSRNQIDWGYDGKRGPHLFSFIQRLKSAGGDVERVAFSIGRDNSLKLRAVPALIDDHPTGAWRAWGAKVSGIYQVMLQDTATGAIAQITSSGNNVPTGFSHDGTRLYYTSDRSLIYQRFYQQLTSASAKVGISGKVLTVATALRGALSIGQKLVGSGIAAGTMITGLNVDGTYQVNITQTVASALVYASGGIELPIAATRLIVGLGDSMTEDSATGYGPVLAPLLPANAIFLNQGIGGQRMAQGAARYGAMAVTCTVDGGSIPTSGSVTVSGLNIDLLRAGYTVSIRAVIAGVLGYLAFIPTANSNAGGYTFTPITYPASAVAATGTQSITVKSAFAKAATAPYAISIEQMWAAELIVRLGRNDIGKTSTANGGAYSQADMIAGFVAIWNANTAAVKKVTFTTVQNGSVDLPTTYTTAPFTSGGNVDTSQPDTPADRNLAQIAALNAAMLAHALIGPLTADSQANHKLAGETAQATVNGITYDVCTQTQDGLHENAQGLLTTSNLYLSTRAAKGY